ncbi:MAG TPA: DUF6600 domain-containing protein, partial [Candidatus Polarisedimenticolaceae bacterium]|nr:DUF6600 domain-containing protein [Candidatus Polarisedimenticolaceae bacterium]
MLAARVRALSVALAACAFAGCTVSYSPAPVTVPAPRPQAAVRASIDLSFFYDDLDPYGDWLWVEPYGWVWAPGAVDPFWRPYTVGRWAWSDVGWTWVSEENWGWACYHYGRWTRAARHGWVWIPGNVWAPAWVAWRHGPGVVGWAPLPPEVGFRVGVGLDLGRVDLDVVLRPDWWCFVDAARVIEPRVVRYAYAVGRNVTVIHQTTRVVRIEVEHDRVFNRGIDEHEIERQIRRPLPRYRLVDDAARTRHAELRPGEVRVWRPAVGEAPQGAAPRRGF